MIRDILCQTLPNKMVEEYTGWESKKPIVDPIHKFARGQRPWPEWIQEKQFFCTEEQAFFMLLSSLENQPYDTLKLKADNCGGSKKVLFPNQLFEDDIIFFAQKPFWSPVETVLLSLGIVPEEEIIMHFTNVGKIVREQTIRPIRDYDERLELLTQFMSSSPTPDKIDPVAALKFFESRHLSCPTALVTAVSRIGDNSRKLKPSNSVGGFELKRNEKFTYLCVIGAMASDDCYSIESRANTKEMKAFTAVYEGRICGHDRCQVEKTVFDAVEHFQNENRTEHSIDPSKYDGELLLNITGVLAVDGYGFVAGKRSSTVTEIGHMLDIQGLHKDPKSIRNCITKGSASLP